MKAQEKQIAEKNAQRIESEDKTNEQIEEPTAKTDNKSMLRKAIDNHKNEMLYRKSITLPKATDYNI